MSRSSPSTRALEAATLAVVIAAGATVTVAQAQAPAGEDALDVAAARLVQAGPELVLTVRTVERWSNSRFRPGGRAYLCLGVTVRPAPAAGTQLCLRAGAGGALRLVRQRLTSEGRAVRTREMAARIVRRGPRSIEARFAAADARLAPGLVRWQVMAGPRTSGCGPTPTTDPACADLQPEQPAPLRLRRVRLAGCVPRDPWYRTRGGRAKRLLTLTFDDGPSAYTLSVMRVLERFGARATFFVTGNQIGGRKALLRRMIDKGHEIANHSYSHANLAGGGGAYDELRDTNRRIHDATGFKPCLFRAPYGAVGRLVGIARALGMLTIQWDVDPRDWATPGAGRIAARVIDESRAGSIVVMHDGGGPRGQTVAALPAILLSLTRRGYRFVTVSQMLGMRPVYR